MKRSVLNGLVAVVVGLLGAQIGRGQGTITYVSNLGQPSTGSVSVGSDSWYAADFFTGANAGGYLLNSIQLQMTDASGDPSGFTVMIYSSTIGAAIYPNISLGSLNGSASPTTGGLYTYTSASGLMMSPNTDYFVVLTSSTSVANGAYGWNVTSTGSPGFNSYHWGGEIFFAQSSDGLNWGYVPGAYGQYSLDATAAPEPGTLGLLALGGLAFGLKRWNEKKRS